MERQILPKHTNSILTIKPKLLEILFFPLALYWFFAFQPLINQSSAGAKTYQQGYDSIVETAFPQAAAQTAEICPIHCPALPFFLRFINRSNDYPNISSDDFTFCCASLISKVICINSDIFSHICRMDSIKETISEAVDHLLALRDLHT